MSALQYLEDLFVKYQRLNQILKDNWSDDTQEKFDNNYLSPIATEWSMYHSSAIDLKNRLKLSEIEINDEIANLTQMSDRLLYDDTCRLHEGKIYSVICRRDYQQYTRNFILNSTESNYLGHEDLIEIAWGKFPLADEIENPAMIELILIR